MPAYRLLCRRRSPNKRETVEAGQPASVVVRLFMVEPTRRFLLHVLSMLPRFRQAEDVRAIPTTGSIVPPVVRSLREQPTLPSAVLLLSGPR